MFEKKKVGEVYMDVHGDAFPLKVGEWYVDACDNEVMKEALQSAMLFLVKIKGSISAF